MLADGFTNSTFEPRLIARGSISQIENPRLELPI
jgi:hypothetical protein